MGTVDDAMVVFLRARFREDETAALALKSSKNEDMIRVRDRALADVETKRRLLDWVLTVPWDIEDKPRPLLERALVGSINGIPLALRSPVAFTLLASYVDHPDFPPEWKRIVS
ncbi:DUF6221 family protein [Streptomyces californicus]|uniref:DUF6221 family protein n=1 Tax=Streptomyces californicus TaxID=67351 RepID=UPI00296E5724|nr:DUF6221 family protein [Streptomyces californicus]MDW4902902.1 DUF6221 family protein [Streptomyces californicus]